MTRLGAVVAVAVLAGGAAVSSATSAAAISTPPPTVTTPACPGYSGQNNVNPFIKVAGGLYTPGNRTAYKVATMPASVTTAWGTPAPVTVSWGANPYNDISWQSWLHSLKWLGALVTTGGGRTFLDAGGVSRVPTTEQRWDALGLALGATKHYLATYPKVATAPNAVQASSFAHRAQFLSCLIETMGPANAPSWLTTAAAAHAAYLNAPAHYAAIPNQAIDQALGVLSTGCVLAAGGSATGRAYRNAAITRLGTLLDASIGPDGVPLEQAPGYSAYMYALWVKVTASYKGCGLSASGAIPVRTAAVPAFLAHATRPDGKLLQLGDTVTEATPSLPGSEYAASSGATGTAPAQRVKIFSPSGFVFGRSSWYPFGSASFYSVRFGPPVAHHGHSDRTAVTWVVGGQDRLVDSGHVGYALTDLRNWLRRPEAHNLVSADEYVGFRAAYRTSNLLASSVSDTADSFLVDAQAYGYNTSSGMKYTAQRRGVLIARDPDLLVVRDLASGAPKSVTWRQHWHLPVGWGATVLGPNRVEAVSGGSRTTLVRVMTDRGSQPALLARSYQAPGIGSYQRNVDVQFPAVGTSMGAITVIAPVASGSLTTSLSAGVLTVVSGGSTVRIGLNANGSLTRLADPT
ncbi:MAG: heparinase II/III family protein [Kineosporiaceae bacterium]|nr:heparinase II/III family protein [Kineosporiaceae bacterium]